MFAKRSKQINKVISYIALQSESMQQVNLMFVCLFSVHCWKFAFKNTPYIELDSALIQVCTVKFDWKCGVERSSIAMTSSTKHVCKKAFVEIAFSEILLIGKNMCINYWMTQKGACQVV